MTLDLEEDNGLASEYVLGLLDPDEVRLVEERIAIDPEFRELVARWTEDLVTLTDDIPPITPPRPLQAQVMRRLFPEDAPTPRKGWGWWPWLLGGAAAAALAVVAVNPGLMGRGAVPDYAARIAADNGSLVVEARFDRDTGQLEVSRVAGDVPEGRDLELWLVDQATSTTTSLGVLPREATGTVTVRAELGAGFANNLLALSVEPLGGSPTGQATGPVVAVGPITDM